MTMMKLRIYNTLTGGKESFEPLHPGLVKMYVCGPTVYGPSHIGHARSVVVFDVIARYFRSQGLQVNYVRNFTDVDDKIINRAAEEGVSTEALSEKYIQAFYRDMDALFVERATHEPRATEHITDIIGVIEKLVEGRIAYEAGGDVFFSVAAFPEYGKLSGRRLEDMATGSRIAVDERKKSPHDFVLWKAAKPGEPSWESPWGVGRPGWHIECSAMSAEFLGETFDIHGGGKDLIFPHHENEIAQSEAAFGRTFARFWIHNGFVRINQEKMSKSLNNYLMVEDILADFHPEAVRLFLLSNHYRSPVDFSETSMHEAVSGLDKLYTALGRAGESLPEAGRKEAGEYRQRFCRAMDDDFNTARGLAEMFDAARHLNRLLDEGGDKNSSDEAAGIRDDLLFMGNILGLFNTTAAEYFQDKKEAAARSQSLDPAEIDQLVEQRRQARKNRDFAEADRIRDELLSRNIILEDLPDGTTTWKTG